MCTTCYNDVVKGKVPTMAAVNGFRYPPRPAHLPELTEVAEHVLAPRIPFQQITHLGRLGRRGQYGLRGSVISIPTEPSDVTKKVIPLLPEDDQVCVVNLKRKLTHKRAYASSDVNREMIRVWGSFLAGTELYKKHNIVFDESRLVQQEAEEEHDIITEQVQHTVLIEDAMQPVSVHAEPDPLQADPLADEINIAPGEGRQPLSVVWDREAEELSFPSVYLGEARKFDRRTTRYTAMKSEVQRFDRRGARPQPLLYKYAVHCREQVSQRLRHRFKRGSETHLGGLVTKENIMDPKFIASSQKKGFAVPTLMPNSAQYWQSVSHDLFAMVRQVGKPALFLTVSAAEYHWPLLLKSLKALSNSRGQMVMASHTENTEHANVPPDVLQDIETMVQESNEQDSIDIPGDERLKLIREDPVVCAMYFQEVVRLVEKLLKQRKGPMGRYPVTDFFFRIEFQARGSPHLHALLWIENAPDPLEDPEGACKFADELLTCSARHTLAERNRHNHTTTCFKSRVVARRFAAKQLDAMDAHRHCRFGAPFWPTPYTRFIKPLYEERDERSTQIDKPWKEYLKDLKELRLRLKDVLASDNCPETLEQVWRLARCPDDETYLLAVRSGVMHPTFMYKREVADRWQNPCMLWVVEGIESNSDAQLIADVYSLVRYCVSYITKGEKCRSELYKKITTLRLEKGFDDRALLQMLSSEALRAKETSAQEAAWVLLKYAMSKKSRFCRFIDTSPPEQRTRSPKSTAEIGNLPTGSTDVWRPDIYDTYAKRPEYLNDVSLAVYVAKYHNCTRRDKDNKNIGRLRDWFIRYRKYDCKSEDFTERENFYRAMCTLHLSWRDERADILRHGEDGQSFETLYNACEEKIMEGRRRFEAQLDLDDTLEAEVQTCVAEDETEANEATDRARRYLVGQSKYVFDDTLQAEYMDDAGQDISVDLPNAQRQPRNKPVVQLQRRGKWDDETYRQNIRELNPKQKEVVLTIIDGIRLRSDPRFIFVDGSAGSGKSVIARNIVNAFETFAPNRHPGYPKSVVGAPTGKAAFLIGGETIHSIYRLVCDKERGSTERAHSGEEILPPLGPDRLAHLQNEFCDLYGQVIDEVCVSMLSQKNLLSVDERCRMAKGTRNAFGGIWTIFLGDFRQLEPVCGTSIYSRSTNSIAGCTSLWRRFEYTELTQNMRQGEQKEFALILKKIGDAEPLADNERKMLESRMIRKNNLEVPPNAIRIFKRNKDVDNYNIQKLHENPHEKIIPLEARDRMEKNREYVHSGSAKSLRRREASADYFLEKARALTTQQARGLPSNLLAVVGFPYMLTVNIDTSDGLVNGAVGILEWIEVGRLLTPTDQANAEQNGVSGEESLLAVRRLWLRFTGNTGSRTSEMFKQRLAESVERSRHLAAELEAITGYEFPDPPADCTGLVPIERKDIVLSVIRTEQWRRVVRQQFPLVPGLAFTIHKTQGATYDSVCVEYDPAFDNELVYVALSRVPSPGGLYIDDKRVKANAKGHLFQHPISADNEDGNSLTPSQRARRIAKVTALQEERARLRSCTLVPRWHRILSSCEDPSVARIVYLNVQSLPRHVNDVTHDRVFMEADVLLFAETWLQPQQTVSLAENIREVLRCDREGGRRGGGVAVYSRVPAGPIARISREGFEMAAVWVGIGLRVAVMYCHGQPSVDSVLTAVRDLLPPLPNCQTLLYGDFNVDIMEREIGQAHRLVDELLPYGLILQNNRRESTTYDSDGTVIDATFGSWPLDSNRSIVTQRYQSYFSHH
ncbi:ATP-dependent DNA helicase, partial [Frankliniella fusca]